MSLKIVVTQKMPGYHELALDGRLDTETHGQLDAALKKLPVASARGVRLDLAKLSYISSMGLRVVMKLMKDLRAQKAVFQTVNLQPQIQKVFDIASALPPETIFKSVAEADAYLDTMQKRVLRGDDE
jgi:anti-anti-sigma factor